MINRESDWSPAKLKALSFLVAIGAKALVIAESLEHMNPGDEQRDGSIDRHKSLVLQSVNKEAECKRALDIDERIRVFNLKISCKEGVPVYKKGRNCELRPVHLRLKWKPDGYILCWKSKYGTVNNHFTLSDLIDFVVLPLESNTEVEQLSYSNVNGNRNQTPFVRLINTSRSLDIKFVDFEDYVSCIEWAKKHLHS